MTLQYSLPDCIFRFLSKLPNPLIDRHTIHHREFLERCLPACRYRCRCRKTLLPDLCVVSKQSVPTLWQILGNTRWIWTSFSQQPPLTLHLRRQEYRSGRAKILGSSSLDCQVLHWVKVGKLTPWDCWLGIGMRAVRRGWSLWRLRPHPLQIQGHIINWVRLTIATDICSLGHQVFPQISTSATRISSICLPSNSGKHALEASKCQERLYRGLGGLVSGHARHIRVFVEELLTKGNISSGTTSLSTKSWGHSRVKIVICTLVRSKTIRFTCRQESIDSVFCSGAQEEEKWLVRASVRKLLQSEAVHPSTDTCGDNMPRPTF